MKSDITRQISASLYQNTALQEQIYGFIKDPYHAVIDSYGLDMREVLKHTYNARKVERKYFKSLFIPSVLFWLCLLLSSNESFLFIISIISFVVSYIIVMFMDIRMRSFLKQNFSKTYYNSNFMSDKINEHKINNFLYRVNGNAVFYSGYSPFVGSGINIGGWSLVVDIDKGKSIMDKKLSPIAFKNSELYEAITKEVAGLHLPNLVISDKVFIDGKSIRDNTGLLPNKLSSPKADVNQSYITIVMNNDIKNARFYKVFQVIDWEGDLVLSAFFRLQKNDKTLFIESNYYLLPPIRAEYKAIDATKIETGIIYFISWLARLLFTTFLHKAFSIFKVFKYFYEFMIEKLGRDELSMRKHVESSPDFDYGASTSIREIVSQSNYSQHFQKLDKERYFKTIEKRLFNVIVEFLDSKNIDSSEFKERESSILNQGVIVTGGNLTSENIAVGKGSKISFIKQKNEK